MKVEAWVATNIAGSETRWTFEIDDYDIDGLEGEDLDEVIGEYVRDQLSNHMEWGWKKL